MYNISRMILQTKRKVPKLHPEAAVVTPEKTLSQTIVHSAKNQKDPPSKLNIVKNPELPSQGPWPRMLRHHFGSSKRLEV